MIKAILFDCFGVLTSDKWREFLHSFGEPTSQAVREIHAAYDRGFISYEEFRDQAIRLTHSSREQFDEIFIHHSATPKNTDLLEYIAELRGSYKVTILSNAGSSWVRDSFLSPTEIALFNDIILSHEVGMTKPDPAIYQLACDRIDCQLSEAVMVDDREDYCDTSRALGMDTILYKNFIQFKHDIKKILTDTNH